MIRFICVEDEKKYQDWVRSIITNISFKLNDDYEIAMYIRLDEKLKEEIRSQDKAKVYIMDIELDGKESGINIASLIRDDDWESEIIFITNHDGMFKDVYKNIYKVFDFVEKFHEFESQLTKDIIEIVSHKFDNKMFVHQGKYANLHIPYKEILYIYRDKEERKVVVVTDKNTFIVGLNINEIIKKLDNRFVICHRACIMNKERAREICYKDRYFVTDTGERVDMLSKLYKKDIEDVR